MKYFLIVGEASGDLHAAHLMSALRRCDRQAEFCFYGGDLMSAVGGIRLKHYKEMAYMGIIPVLTHLPAIFSNMRSCKKAIRRWRPDVVLLVDYPGFNLSIARYVHKHGLCPVFYYISPKIWAWKEGRIRQIKRYVDQLYSILPFETDFFERRHHYPITYVGNPTVDEVADFCRVHGSPCSDGHTIALLPGSRRQEIRDNLGRMLRAVSGQACLDGYRVVIARAPSVPDDFYRQVIAGSGTDAQKVSFSPPGGTYALLSHAAVALVTSGTATLETALFRVPQVVCYYIGCGPLVRLLRRLLLKVRHISLVNLICCEEVVAELVADDMNVERLRKELRCLLPGSEGREAVLRGYERMAQRLGGPGAAQRAAETMVAHLQSLKQG